jgi:DNA-binding ferritin-like protein
LIDPAWRKTGNTIAMSILKHLTLIQTIAKATDQTIVALRNLAIQFRAAQLYAHQGHNETEGATFQQDHGFFGEAYGAYDGYYDSMVERAIGLNGTQAAKIRELQADAATLAANKPMSSNPELIYRTLLGWNKQICAMIDRAAKESTMDEGVRDLIVGIANDLQVQNYKIQQRLGGTVGKVGGYEADQKQDAELNVAYPEMLQKAGTSDGAKKGWETRGHGGGGDDLAQQGRNYPRIRSGRRHPGGSHSAAISGVE